MICEMCSHMISTSYGESDGKVLCNICFPKYLVLKKDTEQKEVINHNQDDERLSLFLVGFVIFICYCLFKFF